MEKVKFAFADGNGEDEFFILEETILLSLKGKH